MKIFATIALAILPQLAHAFEPALPKGARQLAGEDRPRTIYELPLDRYRDGIMPAENILGLVQLRSWRIDGKTDALVEIGAALASQLSTEGYEVIFRCETKDCGGFDFRFNTLVLPPPEMFVDLSNFRFLSARRETDQGIEAVGLMLSRTSTAAMLQVISVSPMDPVDLTVESQSSSSAFVTVPPPSLGDQADADEIGKILTEQGHAILPALTFETGSSVLKEGPYGALEALAAWLLQDATRTVALVGHTDSQGALERNVELSQNRAAAVSKYLVETYKVDPEQLNSRGIGYLAPIASNATPQGRQTNRRVEVILLPTQ